MKKLKWIILIAIIVFGFLRVKDMGDAGKLMAEAGQLVQNIMNREDNAKQKNETARKFEQTTDSEQAADTEAEPQSVSAQLGSSDGVTPEFKEAMDSYEKFFDEYVEFMKKYTASDNSLNMLTDYSRYMLTYAETMEKLDKIKEDDLSDEDMAYYIDTMARIEKKLLEAA